ncbi:MAG: hypothetical protein KKA73_02770 [Chloroflexi bacterium]|nr:hypothetical protein [Chloroflexota bacterium]MBU1746587.1 hypothetical protein [Chloroflexota bacterium]MBU1880025.1 hypothetical protein [Chloroflexota bacterium]
MNVINTWIPFISCIISFIFAIFVFKRYLTRKGAHLLLWGIGLVFYGIGGFCEAYYGALGWNPVIFRLWYLCGAILTAAWLGQGTVYLLARRKWAHGLMVLLVLGSLYGLIQVLSAELDPALMLSGELSGQAIVTPGVRTLTPIFNIYGTATLVGGAAWSAWIFWRKRVLLHRTIGNVLIAVGALAPALGGTFSRLGLPGALYLAELLGAVLMFVGFIRATTPMRATQPNTVVPAASTNK